jgi:hypothetical protein
MIKKGVESYQEGPNVKDKGVDFRKILEEVLSEQDNKDKP